MPDTEPELIGTFNVPRKRDPLKIEFRKGTSVLLLGANGAGKTRLGVAIEEVLGEKAHRIGAHRSLAMNTDLRPPSLPHALKVLRFGWDNPTAQVTNRTPVRWHSQPATALLSDFDALLSALYAEQAEAWIGYGETPEGTARPKTKLARVRDIWNQLLPNRKLVTGHASVRVQDAGTEYEASQMSDGERGAFYLLGHALMAPSGSLLIFDEPELHVNRSILQSLWDVIESERRDCCIMYVTHDLEMAASRRGAIRFAVEAYRHGDGQWDIEPIPADIGLPEELVAKTVGSRVPILFVEGTLGSLDSMIYRHAYAGLAVHGAGRCDDVIRTVQSFNTHHFLHRVGCAGLVDADDRDSAQIAYLRSKNIHVLPVAEVENFMLLPGPFGEFAKVALRFSPVEAQQRLDKLKTRVFKLAQDNLDATAIEATRRKVDSILKYVELANDSVPAMQASFQSAVNAIDPAAIYTQRRQEITAAISAGEYEKVLALYANKGLLAEAAAVLGLRLDTMEGLLGRLLGADDGAGLLAAVRAALPAESELVKGAKKTS